MLHSSVITDIRKTVFAVVDLGSTKVICLIVKVSGGNPPEIVGVGYKAAEGINGGTITNIESASRSILSCVKSAQQMTQETVSKVYVNVSGCDMHSTDMVNEIDSTMHEISDSDIKKILLQTYEKCHEDQVVIHNIPVLYHLDGLNNITELKGLYGSKLKANMHVVTASKFALLNIENCITSCNLSLAGCMSESYASGLSCITDDEKELGAMIIDIGGRYTSIGIFNKGKFVYADTIPLGGIHITNDIAYGLCVNAKDAERIKVLYGNAMLIHSDNDGVVEADVGDEEILSVLRSDLVRIIKPRVEEIFEIVSDRIGQQKSLINKIVITGGSSQLSNIKEVASSVLNKQVRVGLPIKLNGIQDNVCSPIFSAAVGAVILIINTLYTYRKTEPKKDNVLRKLLKLIPVKTG
ncbi:cell division protein FtsA [Ehrlichia ruminantium]|uniref:Cell division protein FtsA n=1 Tax=Ehrlichia ruminantium TaxID=779 RepID=A0AAE6QE62_EHRRU|nr:cell division protein FtsA [Ehrlichia ruminantium]QGR03010.1 cell division protein FtsA [Ehrlichia ruminantium]QGR03935.1 cell division protein FtsA [Ehrlichia ruminantium]QGR04857.1 cell division protein FtsA [Ehrlichia ruminantium]